MKTNIIDVEFDYLVRNFEAGDLLEKFLISAVSSILIIRFFLAVTNYPQIGNNEYHIAHMLLGGFLMTISIFGLLIFLNSRIKTFSAILGGIGFGTFIDELGKFITNDNNYFFQPTIALIYVILIIIYFVYKIFDKPVKVSKKEYAVNAMEMVREVVLNDFNPEEKKKAKEFLKKSDKKNPIIKAISGIISGISTIPKKEKNFIARLSDKVNNFFSAIIKSRSFATLMMSFFTLVSMVQIISALNMLWLDKSFSNYGFFFSSSVSGMFILFGIYFLIRKRRLTSYKMFKFSVLISIFLTQFFLFFEEELSAVTNILLSLIILKILQNLIYQKELSQIREVKV
ncbi:Uncharacterised protein [Candidatus Tiddalikarchaeum anstoanum]|nr:Uncharacterised protein [Candidatus Tiddalikarchaeum anstoanum]